MKKKWHLKKAKNRDMEILKKYNLKESEVLFLSSKDLQTILSSRGLNEIEKTCALKFRKRERSKVSQNNEMVALECSVDNLMKMKVELLIEIHALQKEKEMYLIKNYLESDRNCGAMVPASPVELDDVIFSLGNVMGPIIWK